ncbi:MAG: capsule assembly Wzi family protein [Ignavibacteriaceae bacterium]
MKPSNICILNFKILLLLVFLFPAAAIGQAEYVRVDNPVYNFLERMGALNIITGYNKFEIPKTRKEVAGYLKQAAAEIGSLDYVDKNIIRDFYIEFQPEWGNASEDSLVNTQSLIGKGEYHLFSQNEKYLFFHSDTARFNIYVNLISEGEMIFHNDDISGRNLSTAHGYIGGEIRGTVLNKFGFYMRGMQGKVLGNTEAARLRKEIEYNFKYNLQPDEAFYDETEGYITADFDLVKFKLGRDRMNIGYGHIKPILGSNSPMFDYLSLKLNYEFFSFSFFHGKLLGTSSLESDPVTGEVNVVQEKYLAYHRIGFDISKHINFGIGELVVYGDRSIDLSYLNPFSFYKSIEHANQDRDNSMLFFDINNNSIEGLDLYSTLIIDDISYGKIGSGWWANQTLFNLGLYSANLYNILPLDVRFDYYRIEPYTFTHRLLRNNYTSQGYNLSSELQPNSEVFFWQFSYRFNYRLSAEIGFQYAVHGANPLDDAGNVIKNVGGDISLGHRSFDSDSVSFLDGELEYKRNITFSLTYEPVNQIIFRLFAELKNEHRQASVRIKEINTFLTLALKL